MIQIIAGNKGKGKTKIILDKANTEVRSAKGSVVYLDKTSKHAHELNNKIRLVNVKEHFIDNYNEFIGFVSGIISSNHDIQSIYFDSFLNIAYADDNNLETIINKLEKISDHNKVDFILSVSRNLDELPEKLKKYVVVSL